MKQLKFWYAVDLDGSAYIYKTKPVRVKCNNSALAIECWCCNKNDKIYYSIDIFGLTINDLPKLTWEDEPIKITFNINVES